MFAGDMHPGTSHGEQVGIATISMSKFQNAILKKDQPPIIYPTNIPEEEISPKTRRTNVRDNQKVYGSQNI